MKTFHDRAHFIPKGATRYADKLSSAVVYAYERAGKPLLMGFSAKRQKPDLHFSFRSEERRQAAAKEHFESVRAREAGVAARREKLKAEGHKLQLGSILRCSWGYDQTNVDFYEVIQLVGAGSVRIVQIEAEAIEQDMRGKAVPMAGKPIGKPMLKRARGDSVRISSYSSAYMMAPTMIAGVPTYAPSHFTTYA